MSKINEMTPKLVSKLTNSGKEYQLVIQLI